MADFEVSGQLVDIAERACRPVRVEVRDGRIAAIHPAPDAPATFLLPGFVDAHVHVESSMLVPTEFARAAVVHGTVATVSDPHEIGNVLGVAGVEYMLANAQQSPFKFYFGAPSCVPATPFETAGAAITVEQVERLLDDPRIVYLSEMMNFPGVLNGDPECLAKIEAAKKRGKPVDGHAPGLRGDEAARYVAAGMTTDHECFTKDEALDKLAAGCKISIREGSAARNFDALYTLIGEQPGMTMLCSDDKHPDELLVGHINKLVARAVAGGVDAYDALQAACVTPVQHYSLEVGQLRVGDPADFIEVESLTEVNVLRTWIDGRLVAEHGATTLPSPPVEVANKFETREITPGDLRLEAAGETVRVIAAEDGQLVTGCVESPAKVVDGAAVSDVGSDVLKMVVVNRYAEADPAVAFVKNFGLTRGAIASSVAHDSHNVIAVGVSDEDLAAAINLVMRDGGGLSAACSSDDQSLSQPLPVAGLMATGDCQSVGAAYGKLDAMVKTWGSPLRAPYMTLSFMALLVIPALKLSDKGLFDGGRFEFTDVFV
ncbi:Adenine deaminase [Posidoniimonas polymericola]|uniref:Adenine deaminase n=1 Tax=Posidoniimonas polymericola TaxID=2528002 RepID=A0A5C5YKV9_9BACT|nr:adenine deaminase [Posidoniimonas polymericola]TWT75553.1 Adenine deaminase [Posidoniimonas polymericola]